MYSCHTLVDAEVSSNLVICIVLRIASHGFFCPRAILDALRCTFSIASISLARCGDHTGHAYSRIGLTNDL